MKQQKGLLPGQVGFGRRVGPVGSEERPQVVERRAQVGFEQQLHAIEKEKG
jgi:hypothetical protein